MLGIQAALGDLFSFAYLGNLSRRMTELACLASSEPLLFQPRAAGMRSFALRYLCDRFDLARRKGLIYSSRSGTAVCAFHTGLFTVHREAIFAVFERNRIAARQPAYLSGFVTDGSRLLSKITPLPEVAVAWDDLADLAYDPSLEWRPNLRHLLDDRHRSLLPPEWTSLSEAGLASHVRSSIAYSMIRCANDASLVTPQLHQGRIAFFVPMYTRGLQRADLALALEPQDEHYRVATVYPLEWAYPRARIVGQPPEWLTSGIPADACDRAA